MKVKLLKKIRKRFTYIFDGEHWILLDKKLKKHNTIDKDYMIRYMCSEKQYENILAKKEITIQLLSFRALKVMMYDFFNLSRETYITRKLIRMSKHTNSMKK